MWGSGSLARSVLLGDGVLQLLPGLLDVRAALLGLALGLLRPVARDLAELFLAFALEFLGFVAGLVLLAHGRLLSFRALVPSSRRATRALVAGSMFRFE